MKKLMLGNDAVARGAYEAGVKVASAYPGTPSTEITEAIAKCNEIYAEWAPNEKVALEVAIGGAIAGGRSICAMKHVGLNVAADPLFTASYTGVNAGLVICVADDPGMHSSQNEQDSRHYAAASKTLMLEPADSSDCKEFVKAAFGLSEEYDTPVLLRLSTRVSHSQSLVDVAERNEFPKDYIKNPAKYVMMPAMARGRHVFVEERIARLKEYAETSPLNKIETGDKKIGIIASGIAYQYAKEALGDSASYLKLGIVYPLPEKLLKDFVASVDTCYIIEELDPVIENHCKALGLNVKGKELFSLLGEYSAENIKEVILNETVGHFVPASGIPVRPPVMCAGCPHRGIFFTLKQLKLRVSGDIGCYTLGALPPFQAMDTCVCMGASITVAHGMEKATGSSSDTVSIIGDSTFMHSGITGLVNVVYNKGTSTVIIVDNSITGMTGHQENPTTGKTIKSDPTYKIDLEMLCKAIGVNRVQVVDPFDVSALKAVISQEVSINEPSVIIARRPCALLKSVGYKGKYKIKADSCKSCGVCTTGGCPAISVKKSRQDDQPKKNPPEIDTSLCIGCGYCVNLCKFNAIESEVE